jgi:hypothetical protein
MLHLLLLDAVVESSDGHGSNITPNGSELAQSKASTMLTSLCKQNDGKYIFNFFYLSF